MGRAVDVPLEKVAQHHGEPQYKGIDPKWQPTGKPGEWITQYSNRGKKWKWECGFNGIQTGTFKRLFTNPASSSSGRPPQNGWQLTSYALERGYGNASLEIAFESDLVTLVGDLARAGAPPPWAAGRQHGFCGAL